MTTASVGNLTVQAVKDAIASGQVQVVDVRMPAEFAGGHIPTAKNLPFVGFESRHKQLSPTLSPIFVCEDGNRAAEVAAKAVTKGYPGVGVLEGGMRAWLAANEPLSTFDDGMFI
ncbi:MAG: rhodanese-like domain-containing protein [Dehalococcoidia bacterium]